MNNNIRRKLSEQWGENEDPFAGFFLGEDDQNEYDQHLLSLPQSRIKVNKEGNLILKAMFNNKLFSDIVFVVEDERFTAHKAVLATSCKYFENLFTSGMKESLMDEIKVIDMSSQAFKVLLYFIYCQEFELNEELTFELLPISDKYLMPKLTEILEEFLMEILNVGNFVKIANVVESHGNEKLKDYVLTFMAKNVHALEHREDIYDVPKSIFVGLMKKVRAK